MSQLLSLPVTRDRIVFVRQAARLVAGHAGFGQHDQVRVATAVSELARALLDRVPAATADLCLVGESPRQQLTISLSAADDSGAASSFGASLEQDDGVIAARRLMEGFHLAAEEGRVVLAVSARVPDGSASLGDEAMAAIRRLIEPETPDNAELLDELVRQNNELMAALDDVANRQEEAQRLSAELADTNRGVLALYAELDEKANALRQMDELKTRFFSNMSHELRTPLNAIGAIAGLLLEQIDGPLTDEQDKQIRLIRTSASEMLEIVGDLLDLAKVESGKVTCTIKSFSIGDLFGTLRGMLRPLIVSPSVTLEFLESEPSLTLVSDETKVTQIMRNLLSNAVKFTERGSVSISAELLSPGVTAPGRGPEVREESVLFCVADTGVGISDADQERIFDEFAQAGNPLQKRFRGTGLGLSLCRRLAELLKGHVWLESQLHVGSRFYLLLPRVYGSGERDAALDAPPRLPLIAVCDAAEQRRRIEEQFQSTAFSLTVVASEDVTDALVDAVCPVAVIADASVTDAGTPGSNRLRASGVPILAPGDGPGHETGRGHADLLETTSRVVLRSRLRRILVIDDDERFRDTMSAAARPFCEEVVATGDARVARETVEKSKPDCVVLDLVMPRVGGLTLLQEIRESRPGVHVPVVVCTSKTLSEAEREIVRSLCAVVLSKDALRHGVATALLGSFFAAAAAAGAVEPASRERTTSSEVVS